MSGPGVGELELRILATMDPSGTTTTALTEHLGEPADGVHAAVASLVREGFVLSTEDSVTLTETGELAAAYARKSLPGLGTAWGPVPTLDLGDVARFIEARWPAGAERTAADEAAHDELLASDADRDRVVDLLSEAFSQGRLSSEELEQRSGTALSARSYGELDEVLRGLGGLPRTVRDHPVRKVAFWVATVLASPFVLIGTLLFAFGEDAGDHVGGFIFLAALLPALYLLQRWAWPRPGR